MDPQYGEQGTEGREAASGQLSAGGERAAGDVNRGLPRQGRPAIVLLLGGAISAALYAALALVFPLPWYAAQDRLYGLADLTGRGPWGAALYGVPVAALIVAYWLCWRRLRAAEQEGQIDARPLLAVVALCAVLFALALVWMYPVNAMDLFLYFFRSRMWVVYGANPFVATPAQFASDPYLYAAGEWAETPSLYGPGWELLAAGAALLSGGSLIPNLLALKAVAVLSYGGSVALVYLILGRVAPAQRISGTLLVAWNPLILLEWVGNGHNDALMMYFVLLGAWLWARRRYAWTLPALVVAALCKPIAAIAIPVFALATWRALARSPARWRWLAATVALSLLAATALSAPFGPPWRNLRSIADKTTGQYSFSLSAVVVLGLRDWVIPALGTGLALSPETLHTMLVWGYRAPRWVAAGALGAIYLRQLGLVWRRSRGPFAAGLEAFFAAAMLVPSYRMWYPTWSASLLGASQASERLLRVGMASIAAALSPLVYSYLGGWSDLQRHLLGTGLTMVLPLVLPVALRRWHVRREGRDGRCTRAPCGRDGGAGEKGNAA